LFRISRSGTFDPPPGTKHYILKDQGCYSSNVREGARAPLDPYQTLAAGTHDLVFKLWDDKGNVYTAEKSVTVQ
jgi:hypothetical protein